MLRVGRLRNSHVFEDPRSALRIGHLLLYGLVVDVLRGHGFGIGAENVPDNIKGYSCRMSRPWVQIKDHDEGRVEE